MVKRIIKAQGGTPLLAKLEKFKQELRDRGVKEGSVEWSREILNFHRNGRTHSFHGQDYNYNAQRKKATGPKKAADKDTAAKLMAMYDLYASSGRVNVDLAKQILQALVDSGYDISFRDRHTGKMRTGADAIDGRIGNSTLNALDLYISTANLQSDLYDRDFREFYGDRNPTYNNVAGRSRELSENYLKTLYQYYADNPAMYKNMMEDPRYNSLLAFLTDEAKSMLYDKYIKNATLLDGNITRQLDLSTLARKGLAGSAGTRDLQHWETENVRDAAKRGGITIFNEVTKPLTAGRMLAGQVAAFLSPDTEYDKGGLTYTRTWNPVTGQMQKVAVSNEGTTAADVLGVESEPGRFITNTLLDPLTYVSMGGIKNLGTNAKIAKENFKTSLQYGVRPGSTPGFYVARPGETIPDWRIVTAPEAEKLGILKQVTTKNYNTAIKNGSLTISRGTKGNPVPGQGGYIRTSGTAPRLRVVSTGGENTWEVVPQTVTPGPELMPFMPMSTGRPYIAPPALIWSPNDRPYYWEEAPGGDYTWYYVNMPDGSRRMNVLNGAYPSNGDWDLWGVPEELTNMPTSFSSNVWRGFQTGKQLQHGLGTMYYNGLLHKKSKKKRNK